MAGGYALAGRGSRRALWTNALCAFLPVPIFLLAVTFLDAIRNLGTPHGAWLTILLFSHIAVLTLACTIPRRPIESPAQPTAAPVAQPDATIGPESGQDR